jgi:polysaccharide chain length determinant protein (PEP-CTERM system associated)
MHEFIRNQIGPYLRQLWHHKWFSLAIAWVICVLGWPIVALIPPQYESSGRVYINADQLLTPLLRGIAVDDNPVRHVDYLQRTLLSRPNLEQVIRLSDLDMQSGAADDPKRKEELLRRLALDVVIRPQAANLVTITYRNSDPVMAKNVVQALLTVFSENSTGRNRTEMENAKRFLNQQLQSYETQLRAAERRRAEFHEKYMDLLPGIDGAVSKLEADGPAGDCRGPADRAARPAGSRASQARRIANPVYRAIPGRYRNPKTDRGTPGPGRERAGRG